ncbi:MAG TPA: transketolase, partial [Sinomonas sp.]|nr:transketolase [Sinomonas sp.]
ARVIRIDGHNLTAIDEALTEAEDDSDERPTVIIAKTIKGKGFSEVEDSPDWHGKPFPEDMAERAIKELGGERDVRVRGPVPEGGGSDGASDGGARGQAGKVELPQYEVGEKVATRKAYGQALAALGAANPAVVALDAEVSNSTYANQFAKEIPDRFFEMYIAEQQLVAAATGIGVRGYIPFASTFAAFLTRAHDFIRMGAVSRADLRLVGSHAGIEIGADGPSQMALEDLAMMRSVHGSTVLYPSDATSTAALVERMAETSGISYLRTTRGAYPVLYGADEDFAVGGSKTLREGDDVTLVGAGVTLHACLEAAEQLEKDGIHARVIDCYSIKPIDEATLRSAADATGGKFVVVEDHHPEGGLGSAVAESLLSGGRTSLELEHLAVRGMPGSGTGPELMAWAKIDAAAIAEAARRVAGRG